MKILWIFHPPYLSELETWQAEVFSVILLRWLDINENRTGWNRLTWDWLIWVFIFYAFRMQTIWRLNLAPANRVRAKAFGELVVATIERTCVNLNIVIFVAWNVCLSIWNDYGRFVQDLIGAWGAWNKILAHAWPARSSQTFVWVGAKVKGRFALSTATRLRPAVDWFDWIDSFGTGPKIKPNMLNLKSSFGFNSFSENLLWSRGHDQSQQNEISDFMSFHLSKLTSKCLRAFL